MGDERDVLEGQVLEPRGPSHNQPAPAHHRLSDSLPAAEGVFRSLFWEGVRFISLRKAMERYESAVKAATAVEYAREGLVHAYIDHSRARQKLGELEDILSADTAARQRQWKLAQLRDEKEAEELKLEIARTKHTREQLERPHQKREKREKSETDYAALLGTIVTRRNILREAEEAAIGELLKGAGVEREEDLPEDSEVRRDLENIRDMVRNLVSRQWHEPEEGRGS